MRLFIAEKPSLGRAIAQALTGPQSRAEGCIRCGEGDVVAWCVGHVLELAPLEAYSPAYKKWSVEDLPIVPEKWKLTPSAPEILAGLKRLLKDAARVVHAGDPDREGQLLVDEVIEFLGYRGPVDRLLIRDMNPDAVRRQLTALEPNDKYQSLCQAALARQRADWLFGMNMTRLYTVLGRQGGYDGVLSVGRVQTPLLGLIVARDRAIEAFRPTAHFAVTATLRAPNGATFLAAWVPGDDVQEHVDEEKRLLSKKVAEHVQGATRRVHGTISERSDEPKVEAPPLPYALADLQVDAGRRFGLSAQAVLDACQSLYETQKLTTYPRSDCAHLPSGHFKQAPGVLAAAARQLPHLGALIVRADLSLRSKAWNDAKVTAHHAIIPTLADGPPRSLSDNEGAIYELIARRYLTQFYPPLRYLRSELTAILAGERFRATGRQILAPGWRVLLASAADESAASDPALASAPLPPIQRGEAVEAIEVAVAEKFTQPPKPFTDASLIEAMCHVGRFVSDPVAKKILSETDGIGTPATRGSIIETLFERGYVVRERKSVVSTPTGRALIQALPRTATTPDMTAVWEAAMRAIVDGRQTLDAFIERVHAELCQLVSQGKSLGSIAIRTARACAQPGCSGQLRRLAGPTGSFWSCRACGRTVDDSPAQSPGAPAKRRAARKKRKSAIPRGAPMRGR